MRGRRCRWVRGLLLIAVAGCSHGSHAEREQPPVTWAATDSGIRTKGGDSATFHIHALIAQGQFQEAEAYLAQAVAAGLVAREAATRLREKITQGQQQQSSPQDERDPPGKQEDWPGEDVTPPEPTCSKEMPAYPMCRALPEEYSFHSHRQALEEMKQRLGSKGLSLHNPIPTRSGPCPDLGEHYNVRLNGQRAGSIVCCPCCVENAPRALEWKKCRIVW